MIIDVEVEIKVNGRHATYWRNKGYDIPAVGGWKARTKGDFGHLVKVKVTDLPPESNVIVRCRCERCGKEYQNRYARETRKGHGWCYTCLQSTRMKGKVYSNTGSEHYRWNPNKSEFKSFANKVRALTEKNYKEFKEIINPLSLPRGRMGTPGAYQIDHIIPVSLGFKVGMTVEQIASVANLQMLPWETNLSKASKYVHDKELLTETFQNGL